MGTTPDFSHLDALTAGLHAETQRLSTSRSPAETALRTVWVAQIEKEIAAEYAFLGIVPSTLDGALSDDELLAELKGA